MSLGAPELLILLIGLVPLALNIWVLADAARFPGAAFQRAGTSKTLWIVLPIIGIFLCIVGLVVVILWFASFRGRVQAAALGL